MIRATFNSRAHRAKYVVPARIARHAIIIAILLRHRTSLVVPVRGCESGLPSIVLCPLLITRATSLSASRRRSRFVGSRSYIASPIADVRYSCGCRHHLRFAPGSTAKGGTGSQHPDTHSGRLGRRIQGRRSDCPPGSRRWFRRRPAPRYNRLENSFQVAGEGYLAAQIAFDLGEIITNSDDRAGIRLGNDCLAAREQGLAE